MLNLIATKWLHVLVHKHNLEKTATQWQLCTFFTMEAIGQHGTVDSSALLGLLHSLHGLHGLLSGPLLGLRAG